MTASFETETLIQAPPVRVFHALTNVDAAVAWMHGAVKFDRIATSTAPGNIDGVGLGTKWRETRRMMGHDASEVFEVVGFEPSKRFELFCDGRLGSSRKGEYRFRYDLTDLGGSTRVVLRGEITMPGFMAKILGGLMMKMFRKMCARDLDSMKKYIENGFA